MTFYSNELHTKHKILTLDKDDLAILVVLYATSDMLSYYMLIINIPLFYFYLQFKKSHARGFLMHFFYSMKLKKVSHYPDTTTLVFYE
jgi:hypothetical protein